MSRDQALGAAIRRRREAAGIAQKDLADTIGMAPVVLSRIELGTRAARATELLDITQALDTTPDALLRGVTPRSSAELVESAEYRRDAVVTAMRAYAEALVTVMTAVGSAPAHMPDADEPLTTPTEVREYLGRITEPAPVPMLAVLVPEVRAALDHAAGSLHLVSPRGKPVPTPATFGELMEDVDDE